MITKLAECVFAAQELNEKIIGTVNSGDAPKGCYVGKAGIFFNEDLHGGEHVVYQPVCRRGSC